jgi:hypothetical protein
MRASRFRAKDAHASLLLGAIPSSRRKARTDDAHGLGQRAARRRGRRQAPCFPLDSGVPNIIVPTKPEVQARKIAVKSEAPAPKG